MQIDKIKPLNGQVLVKPIVEDNVTSSGIVLNNVEEKYLKGTVVASDFEKVSKDQIVLYTKFNNVVVETCCGKCALIDSKNILAVLEE